MAGAIIVGEETGVSMSSTAFEDVIARIRAEATEDNASTISKVCEDIDVGHLPWISLRTQDEREFNAFVTAVLRAREKALSESAAQPWHQWVWDDLVDVIRADPRFIGE